MKNLLVILAFLFTISCENDPLSSGDTSVTTDEEVSIKTNPCTLIDEVEIKEILSLPMDAPSEIKNTERTYPTCFYKWKTIQFSKKMKIGDTEKEIDYPTEMSIVLVDNATKEMYKKSTKVYKDGQAVNDVGEMATWGGQMNQLSFLSNGYMVHLHLQKSNDAEENKAVAIKMADLISKGL